MTRFNKQIPVIFLLILLAFPAWNEERKVFRFGYSSSQNPEVLLGRMAPLLDILSEALDSDIEFVHKKSFSEMQKAYINQEIDFGIINAYSYLRILPYDSVEPIAARIIENSREYQTYFFARVDSDINSVQDLQGRIVALGDPYSTSSYLIPHYIFDKKGLEPESDFSKTIIITKQDSLILSVLNRTADAGVVASFIFNDQDEAIQSGLKIFATSQSFPLGPFVVNKNLDDDVKNTIQRILLSLRSYDRGIAALESTGIEGFGPVDIEAYEPLKEIMALMNLN